MTDSHILLIILCTPIVAIITIALLIIDILFKVDQSTFRDELNEEL